MAGVAGGRKCVQQPGTLIAQFSEQTYRQQLSRLARRSGAAEVKLAQAAVTTGMGRYKVASILAGLVS